MCDCCSLKCGSCGKDVASHIGDFSVGRGHVSVYCKKPKCQKVALQVLRGDVHNWHYDIKRLGKFKRKKTWNREATYIVFGDRGYLFLVEWPRSIGLNE